MVHMVARLIETVTTIIHFLDVVNHQGVLLVNAQLDITLKIVHNVSLFIATLATFSIPRVTIVSMLTSVLKKQMIAEMKKSNCVKLL